MWIFNSTPRSLIVLLLAFAIRAEDESQGTSTEETKTNRIEAVDGEFEHGVSFHQFSGPVSGEITSIQIPAGVEGKTPRLDYYAKPDYSYSYGVQDPATGNTQAHQETRQGDAVHGQYSILQADGVTRVVKYVADAENGFQAVVEYHRSDKSRK